MPRSLDPNEFRANGMQRWIRGQSAYQAFFNEAGRAFCLYIVIGNHTRRQELARQAERLVRSIRLTSTRPHGMR